VPRFRSRRRGSGGPRRKTSWSINYVEFDNITLGPGGSIIWWIRPPAGSLDTTHYTGETQLVPPDYTLIRLRMHFALGQDNGSTQTNESLVLGVGAIAWDGTTDNTGDILVPPHPIIDGHDDWVFTNYLPSDVENRFSIINSGDRDAYESRAMRKLSHGTGILGVIGYENFDDRNIILHGAVVTRYLMKVP